MAVVEFASMRRQSAWASPRRPIDAGVSHSDFVFQNLVLGDNDIVGMAAYSIYEQHRTEWRENFVSAHGFAPNSSDEENFNLGENTRRRLIGYRFLAEARLAGHMAETNSARESFILRALRVAMRSRGGGR